MVHAETLHLVHRQKHTREEEFVLFFQRQGESIDDRAKNLEQLSNSIEPLSLVTELEEDVVDGATNIRTEVQELAVYPMEGGLQEVTFPGVFGVEQFEQLGRLVGGLTDKEDGTNIQNKTMVDVGFRDVGVEVLALYEAKEELVHHLNVRPGDFQHRFVFFRVEGFTLRVHGWRYRTEQVLRKHLYHTRVHALGDYLPVVGNIVQQLVQSEALDLLGLHITARIVEVEDDVALV